MVSILDQNFSVGLESTYGTAVSLSRAFEAKAHNFKRQQEDIPSVGFRPGLQTEFSDRQKTVVMGATGSTTFDVLNKGLGILLQGMLGTISGPTQQSATIAYLTTAATATASPAKYYTTQWQLADSSDTARNFTYVGSTITNWKFSHAVGGLLELELGWDCRNESTAVAAGSAVTPTTATTYDWTQLNVTVNGTETCVASIEVNGDLGLKTDRRLMCATSAGLKRAPKRAAVPAITGTIVSEFDDLTLHGLYTAGTIVPIVMTWTGAQIVSGQNYTLTITMPNCKLGGDTPEASISDMTMQPVPFKALYDGSSAACTITYKSVDVAL